MGALEVASLATQSAAIVQRNERRLTALRESTKIEREAFTDAIKAFCAYVDRTGKKSENPERAYSNFTRQVYAAFGLNKKQIEARMNDEQYLRAHFDAMELLFVQSAERSAAHAFIIGMEQNLTREDVKAGVKDATFIFRGLGVTRGDRGRKLVTTKAAPNYRDLRLRTG